MTADSDSSLIILWGTAAFFNGDCISSWFAPGCGSGAGFRFMLSALLPVFDLV